MCSYKKIKIKKTPALDGVPASYYKHFNDELLQPLLHMMNSILKAGKIQDSWIEANISLIPKEGQNLTSSKNYYPVSLLKNESL